MAKHEEFLKQVKGRAENATPGPWHCAGGIYVYSTEEMVADNNDETALIRARGVGGGMSREQQEANVEFVAAANPRAVLTLLATIEKLKQQRSAAISFARCLERVDDEMSEKFDKELDEIVGQG